jgi:hypothetical protein
VERELAGGGEFVECVEAEADVGGTPSGVEPVVGALVPRRFARCEPRREAAGEEIERTVV